MRDMPMYVIRVGSDINASVHYTYCQHHVFKILMSGGLSEHMAEKILNAAVCMKINDVIHGKFKGHEYLIVKATTKNYDKVVWSDYIVR